MPIYLNRNKYFENFREISEEEMGLCNVAEIIESSRKMHNATVNDNTKIIKSILIIQKCKYFSIMTRIVYHVYYL